jgi:D-amino peptidase
VKVLISVDMEGATGTTDPEDVLRDGDDYQRARQMMTRDANAAALGAFDAGATEVIVNDSHWECRNILLEELDPRVIYIKGIHKPLIMMEGLTHDTDAVVFVGYHARTGTDGAVLNESLLGKEIQNLLMDGEPIGEIKLNALLAGHFGVPVVFLSGDDKACEEATALLGPDLETFAVKEGIDKFAAKCLHPEVTEKAIREGVARALGRLDSFSPYRLRAPARFGIDWNSTTIASLCALIPTVEKTAPRITEFASSDMVEAMGVIFVELLVGIEIATSSRVYG